MITLRRENRYTPKNLLSKKRVDSILKKKHASGRALERVFRDIDLLEVQVYSPQ